MPIRFAPGVKSTPPPNISESVVDGWAHCEDARCQGYGQQPVKVIRELVERTIGSRGGDGIFVNVVENTNEYLRFSDEGDVACPHCHKDRAVTLQSRPTYPPITGFPQDGLLQSGPYDPSIRNTKADEAQAAEMAQMRKDMAELRAQIKENG